MNLIEHVGLLVCGLAGFAIWPNIRRSRSALASRDVHGIPCNFRQQRVSRSRQVAVTVAMPCDERFEFTLRRERFTDDLAKTLHLVREFQTQYEPFDGAVYIGADERGIDEWLAQDAVARQAFLDLLSLEPLEYTRVRAITASRGMLTLSAVAKPPAFSTAPDDLAQTVATACVPKLKSCVDRLQSFASGVADPTAFRDPYAVTVRTLSSLSVGLVLVPGLLAWLVQADAPGVELATNPFMDTHVLAMTVIVVCGLLAGAFPLLWGSARLHTVLAPLLLCGALGTVFAAPGFVRELNEEWDQSTPQRYSAQVVGRSMTHGRRSTYYHLWLSDWHSQGESQELRVDAPTYNEMNQGDAVLVTERAGYLGRRWISDLRHDWAPEDRNR